MRTLSKAEMKLVSGGYTDRGDDVDPVYVYGPGNGPDRDYDGPPGQGSDDSGGSDGGDGGGSGDGGPDRPTYSWDQDRQADQIAKSLNELLQTKPDHARVEYGALMYLENGVIKHTPLTPGTGERWTGMDGKTPQDFGLYSWSQVVGIFHHHPTEVYQNGAWVNVSDPIYEPSHYEKPSSGDWLTVFDFVENNHADLGNFSIYVSFNGSVKEYDAYDNRTESRDVSIPRGGHGVESGDYHP